MLCRVEGLCRCALPALIRISLVRPAPASFPTLHCLNARSASRAIVWQRGRREMAGIAAGVAAATAGVEFVVVDIDNPADLNFILGQAHFIKTVEDLYETCFQASPTLKFGLAFCEASGDRKIRFDGNSPDLVELAKNNALKIGAGHTFIIFLDQGYPVNVLTAIKGCATVCRIFCATSNPTAVLIAKRGEQRGIAGVLDGFQPVGVENEEDKEARVKLLQMIGYKR